MATKRNVRPAKSGVRKAFASRSQSVRFYPPEFAFSFRHIGRLRGAKHVRAWLELTLVELCSEVERISGKHYGKSTVSDWESRRRPVSTSARRAYAVLIANRLTEIMGREIGVRLAVNSPWHIAPFAQCRRCSQWHELKSVNHKFCKECSR